MFYKKKKYISSASISALAWRKFIKNKLSLIAFLTIILITITAILGYLIIPDSTPYANEQYLELTAKKPGFKIQMLNISRPEKEQHTNFIHKMLYGERTNYTSVPIFTSHNEGNVIVYETFTGASPNDGEIKRVDRSKVVSITNKRFLLGTDRFGRDELSQLIIGTRVSLSVGFISVLISLVIGILLGALSGFFRGWVDNLIVWFINVVWSIPTLLLVIAITFALGKGFWQVFIAVGLTMWVEVARVVRGQILSLREKEFVEAGRALGFRNSRIIFRHILPNVMGAVIVISAANFASAILIEAGLSFLGIGVQPPMPSWGMMIKENYGSIILDAAYLAILPGLAIMVVVLAFMIIGNGLRDALDVKIE